VDRFLSQFCLPFFSSIVVEIGKRLFPPSLLQPGPFLSPSTYPKPLPQRYGLYRHPVSRGVALFPFLFRLSTGPPPIEVFRRLCMVGLPASTLPPHCRQRELIPFSFFSPRISGTKAKAASESAVKPRFSSPCSERESFLSLLFLSGNIADRMRLGWTFTRTVFAPLPSANTRSFPPLFSSAALPRPFPDCDLSCRSPLFRERNA